MGLGRVKTFRPRETGDAKLNLACWHLWRCRATGDGTAYRAVEDLHLLAKRLPSCYACLKFAPGRHFRGPCDGPRATRVAAKTETRPFRSRWQGAQLVWPAGEFAFKPLPASKPLTTDSIGAGRPGPS
jgi:hypothetical protein